MVRLLVRNRGGSDLHWLVVRFRGERPVPTGGRSLSKASALLLQEGKQLARRPCHQAHHHARPRVAFSMQARGHG